jgi:large subunit ribosomal protein L9
MKVILQQDVRGQGKKGQMVEVSDGYARNYLMPRKLAVAATADAMNAMKTQEKAKLAEEARNKALAEATAEKLKDCVVKVSAKCGEGGRLFGAITSKEISDALMKQFSLDVGKQKIIQDEPIKNCGSYQLKAKLGYEITATLYVVVSEEK